VGETARQVHPATVSHSPDAGNCSAWPAGGASFAAAYQSAGHSRCQPAAGRCFGTHVAENHRARPGRETIFGRVDWRARRRTLWTLLAAVGAEIDPDKGSRRAQHGATTVVEIARALGSHAQALIMDEPTAALSGTRPENLHRVVRELRQQASASFISRPSGGAGGARGRVTVLRDGGTWTRGPWPRPGAPS